MNNYHANKQNKFWVIDNEESSRTSFNQNLQRKPAGKANVYIKTKSGSIKFHGIAWENPGAAYISS